MSGIPMRAVADTDGAAPGDFTLYSPNEWNKGEIYFVCPNKRECAVLIRNGEFQKLGGVPRWGYDGNALAPTLTPSINCSGPSGCGWHGYMTGGKLINA